MLYLVIEIDGECYGLNALSVTEVTPLVELEQIHEGPDFLAGLLNYRGRPVPVLDLRKMIKQKSCERRYCTRIVIVEYPRKGRALTLGLMAQKVVRSIRVTQEFTPMELRNAPYLGGAVVERGRILHCLTLDKILSPEQAVEVFG